MMLFTGIYRFKWDDALEVKDILLIVNNNLRVLYNFNDASLPLASVKNHRLWLSLINTFFSIGNSHY
jgi:hypothetical protein